MQLFPSRCLERHRRPRRSIRKKRLWRRCVHPYPAEKVLRDYGVSASACASSRYMKRTLTPIAHASASSFVTSFPPQVRSCLFVESNLSFFCKFRIAEFGRKASRRGPCRREVQSPSPKMAPNAKESPPKPGLVKAHAAKPGSKPICDQISSSRPSTATSHDVLPALPPAAAAGGPNKASGGPNKTEVMKGSPMYEPTAAPSAQPALTTFLSTRLLAGMGALAVLGGLILLVGHSPAAAPLGARGDLMLDRNGHRLLLDSDGIEVNIGDSLPPPPSHHPHHPPPPHPSPPPPPPPTPPPPSHHPYPRAQTPQSTR